MNTSLNSKHVAAIALGSNIGDREANLHLAVADVCALGAVIRVSRFYDTAPVGYLDQPRFLNAALLLETELGPLDLLEALLGIERDMGRDRSKAVPKGPRLIDLDLLLLDDMMMEIAALTLPHPAMRERRFVLEPLAEIAPYRIDPVTGLTIIDLLAKLSN